MQKIQFLLFGFIFLYVETLPAPEPQDLQTAALMLAGQLKDIFDNGAAARDETKFEFLGAQLSNNMAMGFGDAMKIPYGRRRREIGTQVNSVGVENSMSYEGEYSSSAEYSYESAELGHSKFVGKGEQRKRRDVSSSQDISSSSKSFSSLSSSSSSSSFYSAESEEQ